MTNETPVARLKTALKNSLSVILGEDARLPEIKPLHVTGKTSEPLFQITAQTGELPSKRVIIEFDYRPSTSGKRERTDFRIAFVPPQAMLSDVTWQHHTFSAHGHAPEAAGSVLAGFAAGFFFGQEPTHLVVSHRLSASR